MKISTPSILTGANIYGPKSVLVYRVDVNPNAGEPGTGVDPAFFTALFERLPALQKNIGELPGNWIEDRASLAHLFMLTAVEFQNTLGCEIEPGEVRQTSSAGVYDVIYGYENSASGSAAGYLAEALIQHLLPKGESATKDARRDFDFAATLTRFTDSHRRQVMGVEYRYLAKAARARDIPVEFLGNDLCLYGQGRYQMRRLKHFSDHTSHIAFALSSNKATTARMLSEIGLPVPEQQVVGSGKDAVTAAEAIGYPVVVKPLDSDFGLGVTVGLTDSKGVQAAFKRARQYRRGVIVESFIAGDDHRLLIVNGKMVAATVRVPAHVTGDGKHTIDELVEEMNRDPRRGEKGLKWIPQLEFDNETTRMLAEAGHSRETIPTAGEIVHMRTASNMAAGGTAIDVTDEVHPDNRRMAIWAAAALSIDVAGVDFITPDISKSYKELDGAICEVNTTPGLSPHVVAENIQRDVASPIIEAMYPPGAPSRIPTAVVVSNTGRTATARILAHILTQAGHVVGLSTRTGVLIDGAQIGEDIADPLARQRMIFRNPTADAAVFEISLEEIWQGGLGIEDCDVAAVLDVSDHISGELVTAAGVAVQASRHATVLNADDQRCAELADRAGPGQIILVGAHANPVAEINFEAMLDDDLSGEIRLSALFAASMAHYLGRPADEISDGLRSFDFRAL
ncbi:MAG: hypothetical protein GKS02_00520 [Alphaproteobacteria bacterium]|nr:hypothetical protein [Alphaproteobacteria bacterium]